MTFFSRTSVAMMLGCALLTACGPDEPDDHGYVKLQLRRGEAESDSPFSGTDRIKAIFLYGDANSQCLEEFYKANPNWQYDGVDGGPVFEEWSDRICGGIKDNDGPIGCETAEIRQNIEMTPTLEITYRGVSEPIEEHVLIVGPLPTTNLAECEGASLPTIRFVPTSITGFGGGSDIPVWEGQTAPENKAATGQGAPMKVTCKRNN